MGNVSMKQKRESGKALITWGLKLDKKIVNRHGIHCLIIWLKIHKREKNQSDF